MKLGLKCIEMVKAEGGGDKPGKPSLKVKLSSGGQAPKQRTDGSAKLKVKLPAADPSDSEPAAVEVSDSDASEEAKPKKQPAKRPKRQAKKPKRARTPDEVWLCTACTVACCIDNLMQKGLPTCCPLSRLQAVASKSGCRSPRIAKSCEKPSDDLSCTHNI